MKAELERLGFSPFFADQPVLGEHPGCAPYRVATRQRDRFMLFGAGEPTWANARGRLFSAGELPAVGDWVMATDNEGSDATIEALFKRRTTLVRQAAGKKTESQIIAANLDVVFVVCSANAELNPRRIERYLTAVWDGGAKPVVVINKADLATDRAAIEEELEEISVIAPVVMTSALDGDVEEIRQHLSVSPPTTSAFVGSSGVGKSTLINALFGSAVQATGEIREADDKGRHTTTARELLISETAGILIDTPGMRELALWDGEAGLVETFRDIAELASQCRFRDCLHQAEPGCAVKAGLADGSISEERFAGYRKLLLEIQHQGREKTAAARHAERLAGKRFGRMIKEAKRIKGR